MRTKDSDFDLKVLEEGKTKLEFELLKVIAACDNVYWSKADIKRVALRALEAFKEKS